MIGLFFLLFVLFADVQQNGVDFSQFAADFRQSFFQQPFHFKNRLFGKVGGKHLASSGDEVVGFVDEKTIIAGDVLKESAKINLRIEDIIVIADHGVHEKRQIE